MYSLETLVPRFQHVASVELRPDHLAYLAGEKKRHGYSNLWLIRASAEHLPFKKEVFDMALCTEVIEHLEDDQAGIAELGRVLQPDGNLVLSVPVPPAPRYDGAHVHEGYTYPQLQNLGKDYCLLLITRGVLHIIGFFEGRLKIPPPIVLLCYLERWFLRYGKANLKPYDIVVDVRKDTHNKGYSHVEHIVSTG
jgi:ubiquinone/menaquinone biosynthesis C-methylase UbiE